MIPRLELAPGYAISRVIKGGWHLGGGHAVVDPARAVRDMAAFVEAGITTFDCADIYTGVEELIGRFRRQCPDHARRIRVHTKFVPDLDQLPTVDRAYVERIVHRSLVRLGMERLDLLQFHWWDYTVPRYVEVALELERLRQAGKIAHLGLTNFGTDAIRQIVDAGVPVLTHQLQYSVLDARPEQGMVDFCRARSIALLCYGTVAGGFLSERWLGQPPPPEPLENRSLIKYRLIIEEFGGWSLFQELLAALVDVARRYRSDVATVATQVVLDRPGVAAAIVGATSAAHLEAHQRLGTLPIDAGDLARLAAVTDRRRGPLGEVYALERDREGPHGRIMKYNLNG